MITVPALEMETYRLERFKEMDLTDENVITPFGTFTDGKQCKKPFRIFESSLVQKRTGRKTE